MLASHKGRVGARESGSLGRGLQITLSWSEVQPEPCCGDCSCPKPLVRKRLLGEGRTKCCESQVPNYTPGSQLCPEASSPKDTLA